MFALSSTIDRAKLLAARVVADRKGVTAIEYGLIAGAIAVAIIAAVIAVGGDLNNLFLNVGSQLNSVPGATN
jgi:pilus assembly protein Flp/PilA